MRGIAEDIANVVTFQGSTISLNFPEWWCNTMIHHNYFEKVKQQVQKYVGEPLDARNKYAIRATINILMRDIYRMYVNEIETDRIAWEAGTLQWEPFKWTLDPSTL